MYFSTLPSSWSRGQAPQLLLQCLSILFLPHGPVHEAGCAGRKEQRRRVVLSLRLSRLVEGLTSSALVQDAALPACVTSLEDHGYLLSFGIQVRLWTSCVKTRQDKTRRDEIRRDETRHDATR